MSSQRRARQPGTPRDPYPYAKDITATIDGISPTVVTSTSGNVLTVTGTMTNTTAGPIYDLRYVFQRGEALSSVTAIKAEIAAPTRPDAVVGQNWKILGPTAQTGSPTPAGQTEISMSPGTSVRFVATVPISSADGLIVATRGVYPLMIKVSGDVGTNGCVQYERVGEFHLLATVLSVPPSAQTGPVGPTSTTGAAVTGAAVTGARGTTAGSTSTSGPGTAPAASGSASAGSGTASAGSGTASAAGTSQTPVALPGQAASTVSSTDIPTQGFPTTAAASGLDPATTAPTATAPTTTAPATSTTPAPSPGGSGTAGGGPTPVNLIWPIVDAPHVGVSGIFLDDTLATAISPGGRLFEVLDALLQVAPSTATTIVVDPELLAEIQQMAGGYRVKSTRTGPQSALTATTPSPTSATTPGQPAVSGSAGVSMGGAAGTVAGSPASAPAASAPLSTPAPASTPATPTPTASTPRSTSSTPVTPTASSRKPATASRPATRTGPSKTALHSPGPARSSTPAPTSPTAGTPPTTAPPTTAPPTTAPTASTTPATAAATTSTTTPTTPATPTTVLAPPDVTMAGRGQAAAISYLAALRTAVADRQVLVLPYSDPDAVAMVRAGLGRQLSSLITRGRQVAATVLGIGPITAPGQPGLITTMSMPEGGVVDDATLALLSTDGMTQALLSPSTLQHSGGAVGAVTIDETGNSGRAVNAAVADADALSLVDSVIAKGRSAGLAVRLNTLAAVLVGGNFAGSATPLILAQSNRWTPNAAGLQVLTGLLGTLESGGILTAGSLPAIAGSAKLSATVAYPDAARAQELDPGYLAAVGRDLTWLDGVKGSLTKTKGDLNPDPAELLDPLTTAMAVTMSAGLRTEGRTGRSILRTTEATLAPLRDQLKIATGTSYTLAASTSPLLINVRNDLPYVVTVRVVVLNPQTVGMTAIDPGALSIPAGQSRQFKIQTKVVKAGKFPVQVQLLAADGSSWSDPQTITVRSSAYGTLTVILIIVAGGALSLMVAIRIVQRIRGRYKNEGEPADLVTAGNQAQPAASTDDAVEPPGGRGKPGGTGATGGTRGTRSTDTADTADTADSTDTTDEAGGESTR